VMQNDQELKVTRSGFLRRFQKKKYPIECLLLPAVEQEFGHGTDAVLEAVCPQYS
jgi:hypothetical protein